jgi:hypothetical protein
MTTPDPPEMAPENAAGATEPDGLSDDTRDSLDADEQHAVDLLDEHDLPADPDAPTAEDYAAFTAAVEQVMTGGEKQLGEKVETQFYEKVDDDAAAAIADPGLADYVGKLRRESARNRKRAQESDTRLEAAGQEVARLSAIVDGHLREAVEQAATMLVDAKDLWRVADLGDVLNDDGNAPDTDKLARVIADRVPRHWQKPAQAFQYYGGLGSGATSRQVDMVPPSWSDALGKLPE